MNISAVIDQMLILFLCMALGFIAFKTGVMTEEFHKGLSRLVLDMTMPALILSSVMGSERHLSAGEVFLVLGIGFALLLFRLLLSFPFTRLLRTPKEQENSYRFLMTFSNLGFMGFPVVMAVFGKEALFCTALFQIPFYILSYTVGIRLISGKGNALPLKKILLHPAILASCAALVIYLADIPIPSFISGTASLIGQITSPAAMLIIGSTLATIPLRRAFTGWRLYPFSVFTLLVIPLAVYAVMRLLPVDPLILGVTTTLAAMPAATNSTMLSHQYGGDAALCSSGVFLSTLISLFTIPLLMGCLF